MGKMFLIFIVLPSIASAEFVGEGSRKKMIIRPKVTNDECLSGLIASIPEENLSVAGEQLLEAVPNGIIVYSANSRITLISKEGNCGPVESGSGARKNPYENEPVVNPKYLDRIEEIFNLVRQKVTQGKIPGASYQRLVTSCANSPIPGIKMLVANRKDLPSTPEVTR